MIAAVIGTLSAFAGVSAMEVIEKDSSVPRYAEDCAENWTNGII